VPPGTARCLGPCLGRPGTKKHGKGPASARLLPNERPNPQIGSDAQYRPNPTRSPLHRATAAQRRRRCTAAPAAARGVGRAHGGSRPPGTSSTGFKYREEGTSSSAHPGRQEALDGRRPPSTPRAVEPSSPRQAPPAASGWSRIRKRRHQGSAHRTTHGAGGDAAIQFPREQ